MDSTPLAGLTDAEAAARLASEAPNDSSASSFRRILRLGIRVVRAPLLVLLLGCAAIYVMSGQRSDALMLLSFLLVLIATAFLQESRSLRPIETLRELASPRALVIRSGRQRRVAAREVVRGDLLVLAAGDRVVADARLLECSELSLEEAPSGSGQDVRETPWVYRGTLVRGGRGLARVVGVSEAPQASSHGAEPVELPDTEGNLQQATARLIVRAMWVGLGASVVVALLFGATRGDWLRGLLAGLTLAMGVLPDELPLVVTVFLAFGAWRIARQRVLMRRLGALERLGATTVLCTDMSDTLIDNRSRLREGVPRAIAECREAGIRIALWTGDDAETARVIAHRAGLELTGGVLTGADLETASAAEFARQAREAELFCRLTPEQKLRLVQVLQASGEVVAVTGARVEDLPALRAAEVGIAMGAEGTDVAREAAALVLLDDDLPAVVSALALGRRIMDNLRQALVFLIAVHLPIIGLALLPVLLGWKLVLLPAHLLLLELVVNPACVLAFEDESRLSVLPRRPPRAGSAVLYDRATLTLGLLQGLMILAVVLAAHEIAMLARGGNEVARATSFTALVVASVGLIYSSRSRTRSLVATFGERNPTLWWMTAFVAMLLATILYVPALEARFGFGQPGVGFILIGILSGVLAAGLIDAVKLRYAAAQTSLRSAGAAPGKTRSS